MGGRHKEKCAWCLPRGAEEGETDDAAPVPQLALRYDVAVDRPHLLSRRQYVCMFGMTVEQQAGL